MNGRGYARVRPTNLPPQGLLGMLDSGGGGGGGGGSEASAEPGNSVTPQGHRSGGGRSKGVAKRR